MTSQSCQNSTKTFICWTSLTCQMSFWTLFLTSKTCHSSAKVLRRHISFTKFCFRCGKVHFTNHLPICCCWLIGRVSLCCLSISTMPMTLMYIYTYITINNIFQLFLRWNCSETLDLNLRKVLLRSWMALWKSITLGDGLQTLSHHKWNWVKPICLSKFFLHED